MRIALKKPFSDGTVDVDLDPLSLLCRLVALVPAPRFHTVRYFGVLAPAASRCERRRVSASWRRAYGAELIARHAGELVQRTGRFAEAVQVWFALSIAVSARAPEGTIRRFGVFTEALARGARNPTARPARC